MKRNISINISGIIFHVEEDGYELLRNYLDSISRYFSNYEDSTEIIADIESRIAEIFLKKLSPSKQVITKEDVEGVVATMGSVEDFAAQDYGEEEAYAFSDAGTQAESRSYRQEPGEPRRLYRDTQRKILGGVAAGVAHYFRTDPLWVRLLLILFLFIDVFVTFGVLDTITLIAYIIFWIVVPGRPDLEQSEKIKKLFRNPDDEVIGGVAGGLASYFDLDTTILRLLFVASVLFGGSGLIIYIVLWIITPKASTLTDKMQMKGEPVTLSNIESSVKKNSSVSESGEESTLLKAVLFPFRLVAVIFSNLGRAIGPFLVFLGDAARVLFGLLLVGVGGTILLSLLLTSGITLGMATVEPYFWGVNIPQEVIRNSFSGAGLVFAIIATLMPALALVISGISIIARRRLISAAVVWIGVGIWFVSIIGLLATVPPVVMDFREEAQYTTTEELTVTGEAPVLRLSGYPEYDDSQVVLFLVGHDKDQFELQKTFEGRGSSRKRAVENARLVTYEVQVEDSVVSFPPIYTFKDGAIFRAQELDLTLSIPFDQPFQIEQNLTEILRNTLYRYGYRRYDLPGNTFIFTPDGLRCITCPNEIDDSAIETDSLKNITNEEGAESYQLNLQDFESIEVRGPFRVQVTPSQEYSVDVIPNNMPLSRLKASVKDGRLVVYYNGSYETNSNKAYDLAIGLPTLTELKLKGDTEATVAEFMNQNLTVDLSGSAKLTGEVDASTVKINMTGNSEAELLGAIQLLEAELGGSALLEALLLDADTARVQSWAASKAKLNARERIEADISGAGRVEYRGDPEIEVNGAGQTKLRKVGE